MRRRAARGSTGAATAIVAVAPQGGGLVFNSTW